MCVFLIRSFIMHESCQRFDPTALSMTGQEHRPSASVVAPGHSREAHLGTTYLCQAALLEQLKIKVTHAP